MEEHIRALLQRLALADVLQLRVAQLLVAAPEADGRDLAPERGAVGAHQAGLASVKSLVQKLNEALPNGAATRQNPAFRGY